MLVFLRCIDKNTFFYQYNCVFNINEKFLIEVYLLSIIRGSVLKHRKIRHHT